MKSWKCLLNICKTPVIDHIKFIILTNINTAKILTNV